MKKYPLILFCLLAYLISWGSKFFISAHDIGWINHDIPIGLFQLVSKFGPSMAGIIMIFALERWKGIQMMLKNISFFNIRYKWYLFAIFFELILFLIIVIAGHFSSKVSLNTSMADGLNSLKNFLLNVFYLTLLTGFGEELGWRGFMLPRLQSGFSLIACAIIMALVASFWHLRTGDLTLILQGNLAEFWKSFLPDMGLRILISVPALFVIVYLFNKAKGSLIIMVLFHGASNASYEWVKEITGMNDPSFTLPWFALSLWVLSVVFIPALIRMQRRKEIITDLSSFD